MLRKRTSLNRNHPLNQPKFLPIINYTSEESKDFDSEEQEVFSDSSYSINQDIDKQEDLILQTNRKGLMKMFDSFNEQEECFNIMKQISMNFKLSYLKIKDKVEFEKPPLKFQSKKNIQYLIRYWRQKQDREGNLNQIKINQNHQQTNQKKRKREEQDAEYIAPKKQKDFQSALIDNSLALTLIKEFHIFEEYSKKKILRVLNDFLIKDNDLLLNAVQQQVKIHKFRACELYENQQQKDLHSLIQDLSPLTVIFINIEISLLNNNYTEESNSLSTNLLPYLNLWVDYTFIKQKDHFILTRFLHSLIRHIKDTNLQVQKGFMLFALSLDPQKISEVLLNNQNKQALALALIHAGYSEQASKIVVENAPKLLWPEVLNYLAGKEEQTIIYNVSILSKLVVQNDPGPYLNKLNRVFAQRKILIDQILLINSIDITIEILTIVLDNLKLLSVSTIKQVLQNESKKWLQKSSEIMNQEKIIDNQVPLEMLNNLYNDMIQHKDNVVSLNQMASISEMIGKECNTYQHNLYQSTVSSIIASCKEDFIIAIIPTGSGKTWIQSLVAKYFCTQKQKVSILEPNNTLLIQTAEKIGAVDYSISLSSIEQYYQQSPKDDIIILDEYDEIITNYSFAIVNNKIRGIWQLKASRIIAFSATTNQAIEKYAHNIIGKPKILKFPSQYEMINGVSHLQLGNIICSDNDLKTMKNFENDLVKYYEKKPIILIIDESQEKEVVALLKKENLKFIIGSNEQILQEIRNWEYGVLLIKSTEARGLDTRFAVDGIVLILAAVQNELQYQQYIGRSSRSLGVSDGILYTSQFKNPAMVLQMLQKQNFIFYQEQEDIIKLLQRKNTNPHLIDVVSKWVKQSKCCLTLKYLKDQLGEKKYFTLIN